MIWLVHCGIGAAVIGLKAVLFETCLRIIVGSLEDYVDPPAKIAEDWPAVTLQGRDDLYHAFAFQYASSRSGAQDVGEIIDAAGREQESVQRNTEFAGIGDGRHFDSRFG